MGQIPSINEFPQKSRKSRIRKGLTNLEDIENLSKTVSILFNSNLFNFEYRQGLTKVSHLLSEFKKSVSGTEKVVSFTSQSKVEILDFMLCNPKLTLLHLEDFETILPVVSQPGGLNSLSDYSPIKTLGKGGFSLVTLVRNNLTGELSALKTLSKEHIIKSRRVDHTVSERKILSKLSHPFILSLKCSFQTAQKLHMVLEFCPGGELFYHLHRLGRLTEDQARFYFAEITLAVEYLHTEGILYRDLKPENILIDYYGHIKLADFGTSREVNKLERRFTYCGSAEYMSPEMIQKSGHDWSIDCFSLGSLLFELLTGSPPFYDEDVDVMFWKIQNEPLKFPKYLSKEVKHLLNGLLDKDPSMRLGSEYLSDIKDHPWCADIHWKQVFKKKVQPPFRPHYKVSNFDPQFTGMPVDFEMFSEPLLVPKESDWFYSFNSEYSQSELDLQDLTMDTDEFSFAFFKSVASNDELFSAENVNCVSQNRSGVGVVKESFVKDWKGSFVSNSKGSFVSDSKGSFVSDRKGSLKELEIKEGSGDGVEFHEIDLVKNHSQGHEIADISKPPVGMSKMKMQLMKKLHNK